ncbi:universal stress protein [Phycicoccus endophyticus]|uniref:Universal stress protein n=1 Tax=Phycicoccus endophyticus TaxID=1690220 RepID=A0A7G9R532_9MICO|nr:universal stress protein [Phycicoccus endophyticus]NHI20894.1 universal stress protein [Phycicoccus endophyticus]QNN50707.1 universal stress protein [Phycicoccus endophyticus]GGL22145.1 universal stress protein [Phycicoccus endophyticus]
MSQSRVVVGVDGSPLSKAAVVQAAHFASTRGMTLHVLHAFAPDLPMLGFGVLSDREAVTTHGRQLLENAVARAHAAHPGLTVTTALHDGYASQSLIASSHTAALVVLGSTGHGVLSLTSMGAVAMQVLTHAHCPVLVVGHPRTSAPEPGSRVVAGVDGSPSSLEALRTAVREASILRGSVEVVHAWQARGASDPTLANASSWEEYVAGVESLVEEAVAELRPEHADTAVEVRVVRDEPVHALAASSADASLVVVGARGSGGFDGLHVGSTALRLVGRSECPVLVSR